MPPSLKANDLANFFLIKGLSRENALLCAKRVALEVLASNPHSNPLNNEEIKSTAWYWTEVKDCIDAM
jgi:hypothetical protein